MDVLCNQIRFLDLDRFSTFHTADQASKNASALTFFPQTIHLQSIRFQIDFLKNQIFLIRYRIGNFADQSACDGIHSLHRIKCQLAIDLAIGFPVVLRCIRIASFFRSIDRHRTGSDFADHSGCDISFHANIDGFLRIEISRLNRDIFNYKFL